MKLSKESMKKLGFSECAGWWQHNQFPGIKFNGLPSWDVVICSAFRTGRAFGDSDAKDKIKQAIGITL